MSAVAARAQFDQVAGGRGIGLEDLRPQPPGRQGPACGHRRAVERHPAGAFPDHQAAEPVAAGDQDRAHVSLSSRRKARLTASPNSPACSAIRSRIRASRGCRWQSCQGIPAAAQVDSTAPYSQLVGGRSPDVAEADDVGNEDGPECTGPVASTACGR
ncbi:hypothetical protein H4W33_003434 [Kibdelosporangium phytohabitans]|uniref:hypothetical protein n=1 Tax=Kibdelosporangium phytohabitans TaxID=860235 RepID=UPI0012F899DE|nr:hypothetical protein [Kibdelosporangium phytohabitans]MBE1464422.1 hypothetical protein [Kibdelosporangium phytohabitans]